MSLRRLPLLAVLLTAFCAAPAVHAQNRATGNDKAKQTVLPVWNKGSGVCSTSPCRRGKSPGTRPIRSE